MCPETLTIIQIAASYALVVMGGLAFYGARQHLRELRENRKMDNWCVLMEFLHRSEFRNARMKVFGPVFGPVEEHQLDDRTAWKICSSFDFAGSMVINKLVDQGLFFQYWGPVLKLLKKNDMFQKFLDSAKFQLGDLGEEISWENYWEHLRDLFKAWEKWDEERNRKRK